MKEIPWNEPENAFTLIELLVVIAIIAILAVVVVLVLNPAQLLAQSRDANRASDAATLHSALGIYEADQSGASTFSLGNASSVYVSLPDPTLTGTQTSTCASLGLPALPSGYTYQCDSGTSLRNTDGTGWIPVDFKIISSGSPFGSLPVDPVNASSSGLYYTYSPSGSFYMTTAIPESNKQKAALEANPMISGYPGVLAQGSALTISPLWNTQGLVGYWPLNEGTGTAALDQSGNGNNGTLVNGPGWTAGLFGNALSFNGTNQYVNVADAASLDLPGPWTVSAWANLPTVPASGVAYPFISRNGTVATGTDYCLGMVNNNIYIASLGWSTYYDNNGWNDADFGSLQFNANSWYLVTGVYASDTAYLYINGQLASSNYYNSAIPDPGAGDPLYLGRWDMYNGSSMYLDGTIEDIRLYNRALSPAEVLALYNAEQ